MTAREVEGNFSDELAAHRVPQYLIDEARALERVALRKTLQVNANNRNPKEWTLERWLLVVMTSLSVAGSVFLFGGDWTGAKQDIEAGKAAIQALQKSVDFIGTGLTTVQANQLQTQYKLDAMKTQIEAFQRDRAQVGIPSPQFGR